MKLVGTCDFDKLTDVLCSCFCVLDKESTLFLYAYQSDDSESFLIGDFCISEKHNKKIEIFEFNNIHYYSVVSVYQKKYFLAPLICATHLK